MVTRALVQAQADEAHGQHDDHGSISTFTNSLTDVDTALGWSCTLTNLTPAGSELLMRCVFVPAPAQGNDVAALGHRDTQRNHLTPWWRTFTVAGST